MRDTLASCAAWVSHRSGFSCCRAQALATWASVVVAHRLICPVACRIFPDQRWNHVPCTGASRFLTNELPAKSSFHCSHFMPHPTFLNITPPWTSLFDQSLLQASCLACQASLAEHTILSPLIQTTEEVTTDCERGALPRPILPKSFSFLNSCNTENHHHTIQTISHAIFFL